MVGDGQVRHDEKARQGLHHIKRALRRTPFCKGFRLRRVNVMALASLICGGRRVMDGISTTLLVFVASRPRVPQAMLVRSKDNGRWKSN